MTLVVVDSLESAEAWLTDRPRDAGDVRTVSIHPVVQEYFAQRGVPCDDLSTFIDDGPFGAHYATAQRLVCDTLARLDATYAGAWSASLGISPSIDWFSALYRTIGKYDLFGILNGLSAIERLVAHTMPREVVVYGTNAFSIVDRVGDLRDLLQAGAGPRIEVRGRTMRGSTQASRRNAATSLKSFGRRLVANAYEWRNLVSWRRKAPVTILFENLYDLAFLKHARRLGSAVVWNSATDPWPGSLDAGGRAQVLGLATLVRGADMLGAVSVDETLEGNAVRLLVARIQRDLKLNIERYASSLQKLKQLMHRRPVRRAIWGNDPIIGSRALLTDYLLKSGSEVIGCQHGAVYGTQVCDDQHDSAYSRCTTFLSYGFTKADVAATSTNGRQASIDIVPVGCYRIWKGASRAQEQGGERVDLFYPATNNLSILCSSKRAKVDSFVGLQKQLLAILCRAAGRKIVVKLPPMTRDAPTALDGPVSQCSHLRRTTRKILPFMSANVVNAVLIDASYSTCLLEVIPFDCEVFVMHDAMAPFSVRALSLLEKRVHYLYTGAEFASTFERYLSNDLERRRDRSFMEEFLFAKGTDIRANILSAVS